MGPEVRETHEVVGIQYPHHAHMVEVEALGHHLRTHQDVDAALAKTGEQAVHGMLAAHGVLVHAPDACLREYLGQFLFDLLGTEAQHTQPWTAAMAAGGGRCIVAATVVATQLVLVLVVGQAHIALIALGHPAAGLALPHGHIATPVLEDDGLFTPRQGLLHSVYERLREVPPHELPFLGVAQVNAEHMGHGHIAEARQQFHVAILAALGVVEALQGGCGGAQKGLRIMEPGQHDGHVPCVVAGRRVVLLVTGVVLFIHHDETEVLEGQEQGGACTDHHGGRGFALGHVQPQGGAFVLRHARVRDRDPLAEPFAQSADDLGGERDLRQQV